MLRAEDRAGCKQEHDQLQEEYDRYFELARAGLHARDVSDPHIHTRARSVRWCTTRLNLMRLAERLRGS